MQQQAAVCKHEKQQQCEQQQQQQQQQQPQCGQQEQQQHPHHPHHHYQEAWQPATTPMPPRPAAPPPGGASSAEREGAWLETYWAQQAHECAAFDVAAACLKALLLLGNVKRSLEHGETWAARCAAGACLLVLATLALQLTARDAYIARRRLLLWSHLLCISVMVAASTPQFFSTPSGQMWARQALVLLFKMDVTWPMMAALMHRLPWQDLALLTTGFSLWFCFAWAAPLCGHLAANADEAAFVASIAAVLDFMAGQGRGLEDAASPSGHTWQPHAHSLAAACPATSAGAANPACAGALRGQCVAVVSTLSLWVGVFVVLFCFVLAEQLSKWRFWCAARRAGRLSEPPPGAYAAANKRRFVMNRLLHLHVVLDVPLLLLWVGFSAWHRSLAGVVQPA